MGGHPAVQRLDQLRTGAFSRVEVRSAKRSGSVFPVTRAVRMTRPLVPRMSLITAASFTFASSRVF